MYHRKHICNNILQSSHDSLNIQDIDNKYNNVYYFTSPYQELKKQICKNKLTSNGKTLTVEYLTYRFSYDKKIESIRITPKRNKIRFEGSKDTFWIFGDLPHDLSHNLSNFKQGEMIDIGYDLIAVDGYLQRWITRIQLVESKKIR